MTHLCITLCVCCPQDDDLVYMVIRFELTYMVADLQQCTDM